MRSSSNDGWKISGTLMDGGISSERRIGAGFLPVNLPNFRAALCGVLKDRGVPPGRNIRQTFRDLHDSLPEREQARLVAGRERVDFDIAISDPRARAVIAVLRSAGLEYRDDKNFPMKMVGVAFKFAGQ